MRDEERDRFADELLDAALDRYRAAQPRSGLEERILANLRENAQLAAWFWWKWLPVIVSVAVITATATIYLARRLAPAQTALIASLDAEPEDIELEAIVNPERQAALPQSRFPDGVQPAVSKVVASRSAQGGLSASTSLSRREALLLRSIKAIPEQMLVAVQSRQAIEELRIEDLQVPGVKVEEMVIGAAERDK